MHRPETDKAFVGSIPQVYEEHLVPMIFEPYALDLGRRLAVSPPGRILEIAAGTGAVTRVLASTLPASTTIVATDLNQPMLDLAEARGTARSVHWQVADAMALPFESESFDAVVCQFGVMFLPDKPAAYAEARRVLVPGGRLLFNVWGAIEQNDFAVVVRDTMDSLFPDDPPRFLARTPYGYFDHEVIAEHLREAGFDSPASIETVTLTSVAGSAEVVAVGYCQGTPLRAEIESRDPGRLASVTTAVAEALEQRFGSGAVEGLIQAVVVDVRR